MVVMADLGKVSITMVLEVVEEGTVVEVVAEVYYVVILPVSIAIRIY